MGGFPSLEVDDFSSHNYWSSSENASRGAWQEESLYSVQDRFSKDMLMSVRAVRAF